MKLIARVFTLIVLLSGIAAVTLWAQQRPSAEQLKQRLIGSYKLISYTSYDQNGVASKLPYAAGQISYDAANRMSAQLMRDPAATPQTDAGRGGGAGAGGTATGRGGGGNNNGYIAYFGHYEIDAEKGIVTHHVEGSVSANMLGQAMPRYFEFSPDGASLFLTVKSGERVTGRLQWDRYK
jgi:hypothetical protein